MQNYSSERTTLPIPLQQILPLNYEYRLVNYNELTGNVKIEQIVVDLLANINTKEDTKTLLDEFQECSKTTLRLTSTYPVEGDKVIFRVLRHYTGCKAILNLRMKKKPKKFDFEDTYLVEINLRFIHNHVPNSASLLSFRPVELNAQKRYIELFNMGHSAATTRYLYGDELHLSASNDDELVRLLADRSINPDGTFVKNFYNQFRIAQLAMLQTYNSSTSTPFILCIVTNLMKSVHEKILIAGEFCYFHASAAFVPLNTSITLLYTRCSIGALPLGVFLT
ncbi:1004_t:CDS:2 [Gigaspora margarita]|uniref:1004_t:CDS:1 n=1 Tax=Gigaspora margarita TaxID=4874 RepID=A0ABN7VSU1_GIGMA|nr:1004_t:CDS:2 [Gigaspora margarita]